MSSSTSSFRPELKVVACVALALVGVELAMRRLERNLSIDLAHIRSGDRIAAEVTAGPGPGVLLLGNSLTRDGLEPDRIARAAGPDSRVAAYYPDGSSISEWAYAYRRFFVYPGRTPDFLIIGTGRSHLFDAELPTDRFGAYFCDDRDIGRYFIRHVTDLDEAARFLLARYSVAYANRSRVRPRVFTALIPRYQETERRLAARPRSGTAERVVSHRNLLELLAVARAGGTRVAVVAIPMPERYPLPEETRRVIDEAGALLVDARDLPGIRPENFPDHYHLDEAGAERLTEYLIARLAPAWWPAERDQP